MNFKNCSKEERSRIASLGGRAAQKAGTAHKFSSTEASVAGAKGGSALVKSRGAGYMAEIGRKGGKSK